MIDRVTNAVTDANDDLMSPRHFALLLIGVTFALGGDFDVFIDGKSQAELVHQASKGQNFLHRVQRRTQPLQKLHHNGKRILLLGYLAGSLQVPRQKPENDSILGKMAGDTEGKTTQKVPKLDFSKLAKMTASSRSNESALMDPKRIAELLNRLDYTRSSDIKGESDFYRESIF